MTAAAAVATCTTVVLLLLSAFRFRPNSLRSPGPPPHSTASIDSARTARLRRFRRRSLGPPAPRAVADWCDDLARQLRSGAALRECLGTTVAADPATRTATAPLRLAIERGRPTADALAERAERDGPHLELARNVIRTAATLGGPAALAIDRTAAVLRQRAADHDERAAQAAQARLSGHVLTAVPLAMLALLLVTDADVRNVVTTPIGAACVAAGLLLNTIGWWWMRKLVGASP